MKTVIAETKQEMGRRAADHGARLVREAIAEKGAAAIIVATGASQFEMLAALAAQDSLRWDKVTAFHLDEYVGMEITHGASFRRYLWERFVSRLPLPLKVFHYVNAETDPEGECRRLGEIIRRCPIDVAFIGIGENGHVAFNDPPADFESDEPYVVVELDEACRRQQLGEGWFQSLAEVPARAISMSVRQILKSRAIVCTVPDQRKAEAVRNALEGPVTPAVPASILQQHPAATLFLDTAAASLLAGGLGNRRSGQAASSD